MTKKFYDGVDKYKKSILIKSLVINGIIFGLLAIFAFLYIKPGFDEVTQNKEVLAANIDEYEKIEKNGIDYNTFKSLIPGNNKNLKTIVDKMGVEFFNSSLKNTTSTNYITFLNSKKSYVNDLKKSDLITKRDEKVSTVLPFFTPGVDVSGSITDLGFTNYIETLLKTFSIRTNSQIGLGDVIPLSSGTDAGKKKADAGSEIYYADLLLNLEGKKSDILDFLYFVQNVGNIDIENKNNTQDIIFHKDNYLNKVMIGQTLTNDYNIYQNKFMDIMSITLSKYIDEDTNLRPENQKTVEGFLNFIKSSPDSGEPYQVTTKLRFYFRGLPSYKIELFVQGVLDQYTSLKKDAKTSLGKTQNRDLVKLNPGIISVINSIKSIEEYLAKSEETYKKIQSSLNKKENFENIYYTASDFKYDLDTISSILEKDKQELEKTLNIKK